VKAYVVGGAVRDELLGLPVKDRDWVVVGATPEQMIAAGFRPVGRDFPVFLHPVTKEEYALARTERKHGRGYRGFTVYASPEVTLEQDLARRDLTINAIAKDESGALVDPYGGARDLRAGVLRHVSEAFAEDPVRILRVARFAARYGFRIAPETMALMRRMVEAGEVEHLVPERVWQELARGLGEARPELMFAALEQCGAAARLLPGLRPDAATLARAGSGGAPVAVRWALLFWNAAEGAAAARRLSERLRAPRATRDLAAALCRAKPFLVARAHTPEALLELFRVTDALRRPERFRQLLAAARFAEPALALEPVEQVHAALLAMSAGAAAGGEPRQAARRVREARLAAIRRALAEGAQRGVR